jgi:hypothetical protein
MELIHQRDQAVRELRFWCKDTLIDMKWLKVNDLGGVHFWGLGNIPKMNVINHIVKELPFET